MERRPILFKIFLLKLLRALIAPRRRTAAAEIDPATVRRILVLRVDERLGNLILTTPLLAALRDVFPAARLDWLVARRLRHVVTGNSCGVHIIPFEKRALWLGPWELIALLIRLRTARYDLVVDASHEHALSFTSCFFSLWSGAPVRVAHARGAIDELYTHAAKTEDPDPLRPDRPAHEALRKLRLLVPVTGSFPAAEPWTVPAPEEARKNVDQWLDVAGLGRGRLVGFFIGARKPDHRRPVEDFAKIIAAFGPPAGWRSVIIGGGGDEDYVAELAGKTGARAVAAPDLDLAHLQEILSRCSLVVANDTGPLHLAWALKVPTLALLMDAEGLRFAPPGRPALWGVHGARVDPMQAAEVLLSEARKIDAGKK